MNFDNKTMTDTSKRPLALRAATEVDLPRLTDVFFESFHPVSAFMRRAIPDTPLTRDYWTRTNTNALLDPDVRLMVVTDTSITPEHIIALGRFRATPSTPFIGSEHPLDAGTWSRVALSPDHDIGLCTAFIDFLALGRNKTMPEGQLHYLIELVATSHQYKGSGAGKLLLEWVYAEADKDGLPVFVETNQDIVKFYERSEFGVVETLSMPGGFGYEEYIMLRPSKAVASEQQVEGQSG